MRKLKCIGSGGADWWDRTGVSCSIHILISLSSVCVSTLPPTGDINGPHQGVYVDLLWNIINVSKNLDLRYNVDVKPKVYPNYFLSLELESYCFLGVAGTTINNCMSRYSNQCWWQFSIIFHPVNIFLSSDSSMVSIWSIVIIHISSDLILIRS